MESVFLSKNKTDMERVFRVIRQPHLDWNQAPQERKLLGMITLLA